MTTASTTTPASRTSGSTSENMSLFPRRKRYRVPDAVRHSSCRSAEPGPRLSKQAGPRLCSAPLRKELRAALRPGNAFVSAAADPFAARVVIQFRQRRRAPRQHGGLVDVAFVGDLAAIDG